MHPQHEALLKLLSDPDDSTVRLVKEQLLSSEDTTVEDLEDLVRCDHPVAAMHARDVLHEVVQQRAAARFGHLCSCFHEGTDLEEASWLLGEAILRGGDPARQRRRVLEWSQELQRRLQRAAWDRQRVEIMADFLSTELLFQGNTEDYYNERNSLLPAVLDSRKGIPITLTLIYMMVGRRAGLEIEGVNLPGHFIARHRGILFDPFHHGRILSRGDCREILRRQNQELEDWHLEPATSRQMLMRMLANLLYVFHRKGDSAAYAQVKAWSHQLVDR